MAGVSKIYDCLFQYLLNPIKTIFEKENVKFWKIEIKTFAVLYTKGPPLKKNLKNKEYVFSKIYFSINESEAFFWDKYLFGWKFRNLYF